MAGGRTGKRTELWTELVDEFAGVDDPRVRTVVDLLRRSDVTQPDQAVAELVRTHCA